MTEIEAIKELKEDIALYDNEITRLDASIGTPDRNLIDALEMAINALGKQIPKKVDKTEITLSKRKFATELKQLVHQKCVEINHYVSGCNSPFSYLQIADVQESLRDIENTLNIKIKE